MSQPRSYLVAYSVPGTARRLEQSRGRHLGEAGDEGVRVDDPMREGLMGPL